MSDSTDSKHTVTDLIRTAKDSRRGFVGMMATAVSTLVASRFVEAAEKEATTCVASCVAPGSSNKGYNCGLDLEPIGEITRDSNGVLQGLLIATAENRSIPYANGSAYDCR